MVDNTKIIKCPACGKEMKKVFIPSTNFNIDICVDGCGGIYFDNREFKFFDEQHENIEEIINEYQNKNYQKVADEKRICPVCQAPMVKHFCSSKKLINIDECYTCGGIFLDYGELEFIRKQYATEQERINAFNEDVLPLVEVKLQETLDKFDKFNKQSITKRWADALTSMIFGKYY